LKVPFGNAGRVGLPLSPHSPKTSIPNATGQEITMQHGTYEHIAVDVAGNIATIEVRRGPNNFIDTDMVAEIADALDIYDRTPDVRAIVLCSEGKHFCAGADFGSRGPDGVSRAAKRGRHLYKEAQRLWRTGKPIVAAVHGAAIGAGVGLAVMADFRVACPEARFSTNFTRLGFHPGFGLTATLPRLIGEQNAAMMMYTGRRLTGQEALAIGLVDYCVPLDQVRIKAIEIATEIAGSAPLAIVATRETLRRGLADAVARATEREYEEQDWLRNTADFKEGTKAMGERRPPNFQAR
jgi:enoyl-CoA hydratase/carnithine racemase